MKLTQKVLITIGREYGSGGRMIAEALGKDLDIPVFDKNMITMIAEKHGFDEADLESDDERLSNPFFEPYIAYGVALCASGPDHPRGGQQGLRDLRRPLRGRCAAELSVPCEHFHLCAAP